MTLRSLLACTLCLTACATAQGDLVRLKTGGELRGKLVKTGANDTVVLETLGGAVVTVSRADVSLVTQRPLSVEEYESRLRQLANTLEAHWELAAWCKTKGLSAQRELHLQRVVEFDPDHEAAHLALGHTWKDGAWVDWEAYMAARGYVKHKGKYVTQQELELLEKTAAELKHEQEWYPKVRLWSGWLTGRDADRSQQGLTALRAIADDDSSPAVLRFLGEHAARDVRLLGVEVLSKSGGLKAAQALAKLVLRDADQDVRLSALQSIPEEQFDAVQPLFIKELRNETNAIVCRAAQGLLRVGDERSIAPLIESLITSHKYEVRVPGTPGQTYAFGTNGTMAGGVPLPPEIEAGLRTGQYPNGVVILNPDGPGSALRMKTILVRQDHQNAEALAALQRLTGESYGYDERLWRLWWAAKKADGGGLQKS
jgi:hypothetical protein